MECICASDLCNKAPDRVMNQVASRISSQSQSRAPEMIYWCIQLLTHGLSQHADTLSHRCCACSNQCCHTTLTALLDALEMYSPWHGISPLLTILTCCQMYLQVLASNASVVPGVNNAAQPKPLTQSNLNFQNSSTVQSMEYLTTLQPITCPTCYDPPYLRGQDPTTTSVPVRTLEDACMGVKITFAW